MEKHLIDMGQIDHLAELSGLRFSDKEREIMQKQVSGILDMLQQCEDVQLTEKSRPRIISLADLREDIVKSSLKKDTAIGQAVETRGDYIVIPKVVD